MSEKQYNSPEGEVAEEWAGRIASLAVDALLNAGFLPQERFEAAHAIVAEEVFVRLCLNDYPPQVRLTHGQD